MILLDGGIAKFGQQKLKMMHDLMQASEVAELCTFSSINELSCPRRVDNAKIGAFVAAERSVRREIVNSMLKEWGGRGDGQGEYTTRGRIIGRHFGRSFVNSELFGGGFEFANFLLFWSSPCTASENEAENSDLQPQAGIEIFNLSIFDASVGVPVAKEDAIRTARLPATLWPSKCTTGDALLSKLNLTKCEAAVIMPPVSEQPIGLIDGRVVDRTKRSNLTTTDERETSTAPILHLNFKVGEEARLLSRCSKGRAPPSKQLASTLTESAQSLRRGTSHDCSGDDNRNYDDCNVEWSGEEAHHSGNFQRRDIALYCIARDQLKVNDIISLYASISTTISYLLCAVGLFASLIIRVGNCALLKIGSKIEPTGRSGAKSAGIMIMNPSKKCSSLVKCSRAKARMTTFWKYSTMLSLIFWACLVVVGGRSLTEVNVVGMNGLFNTISNADNEYTSNTGNSIMANGDTAILAVGLYKGSEGTCAISSLMLATGDLNGEVKCVEDNTSCVLDGENQRGMIVVYGTGSGTLILRALTFDKGYSYVGAGVEIWDGATIDLELCIFSNNRATRSDYGGGAIYVRDSGTIVNVYTTSFYANTADSGNGDDIYRSGGTITIHNTCPSPYSSNTPIQGKTRMRIV
jgi:predicted outer membrane repeat protein